MQGSKCDHTNLELYSEFDVKPVLKHQDWCHMRSFGGLGQMLGSSILDHLQAVQRSLFKAGEKAIAIVKTGRT